MSGFEIAGIVLGSIPLVIATLEKYGTGLSALQRWRKYQRELQSLIRNLKIERAKLQNVCEKLLIGIVKPARIEVLINNPMGDLWREEETLRKVQFRLGKGFESFEATISHLKTTIDEMAERIDSQKNGMASGFKRAVFTLSRSQYADLLSDIKDNISNLENLTDRNMELEPARRGRYRGKLFVLLQTISESLYRALSPSLNCACGHTIGLGLESRATEVFPPGDEEKMINSTSFKIAFSYMEDPDDATIWEEISVKPNVAVARATFSAKPPTSSTPSNLGQGNNNIRLASSSRGSSSTTVLVQTQSSLASMSLNMSTPCAAPGVGLPVMGHLSLCQRIKVGGKQANMASYGTILDTSALGTKEYSLSPIRFSDYLDVPCRSVISLRDILEQKDTSIHLPYRDRLHLAVVASSSLLQLHGNPWLPNALTSSDIFFLKKRNYPIYSRPFLLRKSSASAGKGKETSPPFCNPALWSLGVLLIEIIRGRTLASFRTQEESGPLIDYATAHKLLDEIRMASSNYGTAVTRCLGGELHSDNYCSGSEDFCQEVYSGVVALLEKDLENS
ncbi:hypothetical protein CDV36_011986 [Fusarium kuroshium]|uniref:DUF7580 domain-containing protein n=1 Tax=Fusarium kuroshium TaxID=2010991 RepID=A0A3M2RSZ2_9HYPO|nr:hypothetical protein CDV36_011986 [Fusarium kuroshium]